MNVKEVQREHNKKLETFKKVARFKGVSTPTNVSMMKVIVVCGHVSFGSGKCPRLTVQWINLSGCSSQFCLTDGAVLFGWPGIVAFCISSCKTTEDMTKGIEHFCLTLPSHIIEEGEEHPKEVVKGLFDRRKSENQKTWIDFHCWIDASRCMQIELHHRGHRCSSLLCGCTREVRMVMSLATFDEAKKQLECVKTATERSMGAGTDIANGNDKWVPTWGVKKEEEHICAMGSAAMQILSWKRGRRDGDRMWHCRGQKSETKCC